MCAYIHAREHIPFMLSVPCFCTRNHSPFKPTPLSLGVQGISHDSVVHSYKYSIIVYVCIPYVYLCTYITQWAAHVHICSLLLYVQYTQRNTSVWQLRKSRVRGVCVFLPSAKIDKTYSNYVMMNSRAHFLWGLLMSGIVYYFSQTYFIYMYMLYEHNLV